MNIQPRLPKFAILFAAGSLLLTFSGCGRNLGSTVYGTLSVEGKPLETGLIVFQPVGGGALASANVEADGTYRLATGHNKSLAPGEYVITISAFKGSLVEPSPENPNPKVDWIAHPKYVQKETSGLKYAIHSGSNEINIDLDPPE